MLVPDRLEPRFGASSLGGGDLNHRRKGRTLLLLVLGLLLIAAALSSSCGQKESSEPQAEDLTPPAGRVVADTVPPILSNIKVVDLAETGARVMWTTDEPGTSYVGYRTAGIQEAQDDPNLTEVHSVSLTNLRPNTEYVYWVESTDAASNTAWSESFSFTTLPETAPAPREWHPIATFTGTEGQESTDTFYVPDDLFRVKWTATSYMQPGGYLSIWVYKVGQSSHVGAELGTIVTGSMTGSFKVPGPGTYYLKFNSAYLAALEVEIESYR